MYKKRLWFIVALAAMLAMLVSACTVPVPPPPASGSSSSGGSSSSQTVTNTTTSGSTEAGPVTLTWAMWGSPEEIATHQKVADAFMADHPDIKIKIMSAPWGDYFTKIQTLWASGDTSQIPDVLFITPVNTYAAQGVLEDLSPYIEKSGTDLKDYWPSLMDFGTYLGKVYGLPRDAGLEVLYYNKDLFDKAGISYPTDDWTWDDLRAAAEKLTVKNGDQTTQYGLAMEGGKYQLWIGQNGGAIADDLYNPSKCTLDTPEAVQAIDFFAGMMNDGIAMRDANLSQAGGDAAVFASGQAAMIIQNASRVSQFNQAKLNYDVATVPIPKGGHRAARAGGAAWVMSSAGTHKDAAWTFLNWLQSTDGGQRIYTQSGEILPALMSTAKSDAFLNSGQPPKNRQAFITEGENAKPGIILFIPEWSELSGSIINPTMDKIWVGDAKPADALPELCKQMDQFLKDNGYPKAQ
jgi:multiple sugar transport system substrate-binding protein